LIHRETAGAEPPTTPRTQNSNNYNNNPAACDQTPSLAREFIDVLRLRERVSDDNMSRFLDELNHQLSLDGQALREAREAICHSLELGDGQRSTFAQQARSMLEAGSSSRPARDMREVVARAVVGMSHREMAAFEHEVGHMLDGSLHGPSSPYREAVCCAAYVARFPEDQLAELRRQLRRAPLSAFQSRGQQQQQQQQLQQPEANNLPPLREYEKFVDPRQGASEAAKPRNDPAGPAKYSLREFPVFSRH
jgi:hypothetical protein